MKIRNAGDGDWGAIHAVLEQLKLPTESVDTKSTLFFIAEVNGAIAGVAGFEFYGGDALLRSVAVRPELQGKGIGDKITDFMIATARAGHYQRIVLLTEAAQAFFARKGFKVIDREAIVNEELKRSSEFTFACPTSAVCMVLDLVTDDSIQSLSPRETMEECRKGAIILDIREEYVSQFKRFGVTTVIQVPFSRLVSEVGRIPGDKMLIVADSSGLNSKEAIRVLKEKGYRRLANLAGGFVEWERDGMSVLVDTSERLSGSCVCQLRARDKGDTKST